MASKTILASPSNAPTNYRTGTFIIDIASSQIGIIRRVRTTINGGQILHITIPGYGDIHIPSHAVRTLPIIPGIAWAGWQIIARRLSRSIAAAANIGITQRIISVAIIGMTFTALIGWIGLRAIA